MHGQKLLWDLIVFPIMYVCTVITYSRALIDPGKVAIPARGQLNREK